MKNTSNKIQFDQFEFWIRAGVVFATIILELFGKFAWVAYALSPNDIFFRRTNYIDLGAFMSLDIFPMLTFLCTVVLLLLLVWQIVKFYQKKTTLNFIITCVFSICGIVLNLGVAGIFDGWNYGVIIIEVLLVLQFVLLLIQQAGKHIKCFP